MPSYAHIVLYNQVAMIIGFYAFYGLLPATFKTSADGQNMNLNNWMNMETTSINVCVGLIAYIVLITKCGRLMVFTVLYAMMILFGFASSYLIAIKKMHHGVSLTCTLKQERGCFMHCLYEWMCIAMSTCWVGILLVNTAYVGYLFVKYDRQQRQGVGYETIHESVHVNSVDKSVQTEAMDDGY